MARSPTHLALAVLLLAGLAACRSQGSFPSLAPRAGEAERLIEPPGAGLVPTLSDEQQESLRADLARERALLAATEAELAAAGSGLDRALAQARGASIGSEAWSGAQMALSRFDQARAPLGEVSARLSPLRRTVDSLPATDPDRQALEALVVRAEASAAAAAQRVDRANRALGS